MVLVRSAMCHMKFACLKEIRVKIGNYCALNTSPEYSLERTNGCLRDEFYRAVTRHPFVRNASPP